MFVYYYATVRKSSQSVHFKDCYRCWQNARDQFLDCNVPHNNFPISLELTKQVGLNVLPKSITRGPKQGSNSQPNDLESCTVQVDHTSFKSNEMSYTYIIAYGSCSTYLTLAYRQQYWQKMSCIEKHRLPNQF